MAKNQIFHEMTKHIDVRFHKIMKLVSFDELLFKNIHTSENAVYLLIKHISIEKFKHCLDLINKSRCDGRCPSLLPQVEFPVMFDFFKEMNISQCGDCYGM